MSEVPGAGPVHSENHGLRVARASVCSLCQCGGSARHPELLEAKGEVEQGHPSTGLPSWPAEAPGRRSSNTKAVCQTHHWNCEERGSGRQVRAEGLKTQGGDLGVQVGPGEHSLREQM